MLAADACSDAVAAAPDRPVTLDAPEPVVVLGDRDHLRQAIANLVTNALRHTPAGTADRGRRRAGRRRRRGRRSATTGRVSTRRALAHVFDRFWQADRARVGRGAGLGLSIVAGIAHEHGGTAEPWPITPTVGPFSRLRSLCGPSALLPPAHRGDGAAGQLLAVGIDGDEAAGRRGRARPAGRVAA